MPLYQIIILLCWAAFLLVWAVMAFNVKRDIRGGFGGAWREYWWVRLIVSVGLALIAVQVSRRTAHSSGTSTLIFFLGVFSHIVWLGWLAAILSVVGVGFAIWARVSLGRNWSAAPSVKEKHELVTSGPYAYVRHPIYTGLILMALAATIAGSIFGLSVFIFATFLFILRIRAEEKIMLELFPDQYPEYQKRTKRLIPFVW